MKIQNVYYCVRFKKSLDNFNSIEKKRIKQKLQQFLNDPFNPQLKTHKLSGKLNKYWSFSITYQIRIMFEFIDSKSVGLVDIGTHKIYQ